MSPLLHPMNLSTPMLGMMNRAHRWRLLLLAGSIVSVILLGVVLVPGSNPRKALDITGYWLLALLFVFWVLSAYSWGRRYGLELWRMLGWWGLAGSLLVWGVLISRQRADFQVVMDEPLQVCTALGMHVRRSVTMPAYIGELNGVREYYGDYLDKRPLFFPFLLSVVHEATGYRVENVFWLNKALALLLVALGWACGRKLDPKLGGPLMLLWLCGWPLLSQSASSGGLAILNLVLLLVVLLAAMAYCRERDPVNERFLLTSCLLLGNTRYESILFLAVFGGLWLLGAVRSRNWSLSGLTAFSPLFLIPYLWQHSAIAGELDRWELKELGTDRVFGSEFILDNLARAGRFFAVPDRGLAGSAFLSCLGMLGLAAFCVLLVRKWGRRATLEPRAEIMALSSVLLVVGANFCVLMCFFYGRLDMQVTSRLGLPQIAAMGLVLCAIRPMVLNSVVAQRWLLGTMALWVVAYALPSMNEHRYSNGQYMVEIFRWSQEVIARQPCRKPLVLGSQDLMWTAYRVPARPFESARRSLPQIEYLRQIGAVDDVFVVQSLVGERTDGPKTLIRGNRLPDGVELEIIAEKSLTQFNFVRVSRVTAIDLVRAAANPIPPVSDVGVFEGLSPAEADEVRQALP